MTRPCLRCSLLAGVPWGPSVLSCLSLGWWSRIPETAAPESVQTKVPSLTRGQVRPQLLYLPSTYTPLTRLSLQDGPPSSTRRRMTAATCPSSWRAQRMAGSRTHYFCGRVPRRHAHPDPPLNERALAAWRVREATPYRLRAFRPEGPGTPPRTLRAHRRHPRRRHAHRDVRRAV